MKIAVGSDHGGFEYKNKIIANLKQNGYEIEDFGTYSAESCDYPLVGKKVAQAVAARNFDRGILICGTGIGMCIAANKVKGIRAALCGDTYSARMTREHNDSNILCLGERVIGDMLALDITYVWLKTEFSGSERHLRRINMLD